MSVKRKKTKISIIYKMKHLNMRASEIVMTLCAIDDHEKVNGLSQGQKAWKTRLKNQLIVYHITWAKLDLQKAICDFFIPINNRESYRNAFYDMKFRKDSVIALKNSRLKYQLLKK